MSKVTLKTNHGSLLIELDEKAAPITVKNFENYVNKGFYNDTIFHRVIDGFMIQDNNNFLDFPGQDGAGYCVFGKVIEGHDVVDKIAKVSTGSASGHQDVPSEVVIIEEVST